MKNAKKIRYCKNKKCHKVLPEGYKHKYCEACRNEKAEQIRTIFKAIIFAVPTLVVLIFTAGKINLKDKV